MSNNSWQPAISFSWIAFIFSWCCSDAASIQHVLGKLTSQSSLQVLVVPVGVSGLKSCSSWRSEKSHCSSGKVSKSEIKPKAWRNSTEAHGPQRPCKKSYWNPESVLNEWTGSPGRETAQGEGTERERACWNKTWLQYCPRVPSERNKCRSSLLYLLLHVDLSFYQRQP